MYQGRMYGFYVGGRYMGDRRSPDDALAAAISWRNAFYEGNSDVHIAVFENDLDGNGKEIFESGFIGKEKYHQV